MKKIFIILAFVLFLSQNVYADEIQDNIEGIESNLELYDFSDIDSVISNGDFTYLSIKDLIMDIISGNFDFSLSGILDYIFKIVFAEVSNYNSLMRNLIIVCILSAVLRNLTDSFKYKETGELGFYISYIVLIMILFSSFSLSIGILEDTADNIIKIMNVSLPVVVSMLVMSGNASSAYVFHPVVMLVTEVLSDFIRNLLVPVLIMSAVIQILNYLTEKDVLNKFSALLKNCASWGLKGSAFIFMGIISFHRFTSPILNSAVNKTAKAAINMVPVVGDVFAGTVDSVMYWTGAVKNGFSISVVIVIIFYGLIPVLKLLILIALYKVIAAVIQPVCDKRIANCIDTIGDYTALILSFVITIMIMFIFAVMVMLSVTCI